MKNKHVYQYFVLLLCRSCHGWESSTRWNKRPFSHHLFSTVSCGSSILTFPWCYAAWQRVCIHPPNSYTFCLAPGYFKASKKFYSPENFCSRRQLIACHEVLSYCWIGRWDASETQLARKAYSPFGQAKKKNWVSMFSFSKSDKVLVIAPHPDDESLV